MQAATVYQTHPSSNLWVVFATTHEDEAFRTLLALMAARRTFVDVPADMAPLAEGDICAFDHRGRLVKVGSLVPPKKG